MRIGLVDVDGHNYPNYALMKISAWHKERGDSVEWADENPNKRKIYTKDELYKMGFAFDTNGNIADPKRDAEMWDRYVEYKQDKWFDKVCKHITPILKTYCSDECVKELIEGLRNKMDGDL